MLGLTRSGAGVRARRCVLISAALVSAGLSMMLAVAPAAACGNPQPPVRQCGPTAAFWKIGLRRVIIPTNSIAVNYCFRPSINQPCPPGFICIPCAPILNAQVTITITTLGGVVVGTNTVVIPGAMIIDNANNCPPALIVPVAGAGGGPLPPGLYRVAGSVVITLTDGTTITANGDTCVAVVEESAGVPGAPRLDVENMTADSDAFVHPGDGQRNVYRFTNNDPDWPVTVEVTATNRQNSRLAEISEGPGVPDLYDRSLAEPFEGDHFPVSFKSLCPPLPPVPGDTAPQSASETYTIPPLSSMDVPIYSRGFPLCNSGSGCEQIVEVDAVWDDGTSAEVCVGGITVTDSGAPPAFDCPDSGSRMTPFPLAPDILALEGMYRPDESVGLTVEPRFAKVFVNGQTFMPKTLAFQGDGEDGQVIYTGMQLPPLPTGGVLGGSMLVDLITMNGQLLDGQMGIAPNVPGGFAETNPTAKGLLMLDTDRDADADARIELLTQFVAEIYDETNPFAPVQIIAFDFVDVSGTRGPSLGLPVSIGFSAQIPPTSAPTQLTLSYRLRGYAGNVPGDAGCNAADLAEPFGVLDLADINAFVDGFLNQDPAADLNGDTIFDLVDIGLFVDAFLAGCP